MNFKNRIVLLLFAEIVSLCLFYATYILGLESFYFADATFWLQPMAQFVAQSFELHRFPLWNPLCYCGMPQLAVTFPNLLYPPDYLFFFLPFSSALALSMVFHQSIAAIGAYLLIRALNQPAPSAVTGALAYSLSGYMFALAANHSLVAGAAWFPLAVWSIIQVESCNYSRLFWYSALGAGTIFMLVMSGRPEIFVPSLLVLACYVGWSAIRLFSRAGNFSNERLVWQIRVLFLGICLSLPSVLPTAEWLSASRRAAGLDPFEVFLNSATWYDLVSSVIGQALGDLRLHGSEFRPLVSPVNIPPYLSCAYVGTVTVTLAAWGLLAHGWRIKWLFFSVMVLAIVASLGSTIGLMPLVIKVIPAMSFIRFPVKLLFLAILPLSILAARGMTACIERRDVAIKGSYLWCLVGAASLFCCFASHTGNAFLRFDGFLKSTEVVLRAQERIGEWGLVSALIGLGVGVIAWCFTNEKLSQRATIISIISLMYLSLLGNAVCFERLASTPDYYKLPSFAENKIREMKGKNADNDGRILGLCLELLTVPDAYLSGSQKERTAAVFQYDRQILQPNTNLNFNLPTSFGFEGTMRGDYYHEFLHSYFQSSQSLRPSVEPASDMALSRFAQVTATNFIITQMERRERNSGALKFVPPLAPHLFKLRSEDRTMNVRIYEVLQSLPRSYLTHSWRRIDFHNQALDSILDSKANDFDPLRTTLMEASVEEIPVAKQVNNRGLAVSNEDIVRMKEIDPSHLLFETESSQDAFLVLADQPYPGWEAKLDNSPTPIFIANAFNRAVFVPAGKHSVSYEFSPKSFHLGLIVFGLAILLLGYLYWIHRCQSRAESLCVNEPASSEQSNFSDP